MKHFGLFQICQKILLGICLFLIVFSAFFSIFNTHIYRIEERIERLKSEIKNLDSKMQIREFRGVVRGHPIDLPCYYDDYYVVG